MTESDPIERVDDLLGDVRDRFGERPLADQELVGAAGELALGFGRSALEVDRRRASAPTAGKRGSPASARSRRESGRAASTSSAEPSRTRGSPAPASSSKTKNETMNPRRTDEGADSLGNETACANHFLSQSPIRDILILDLTDHHAHRRVEQAILGVRRRSRRRRRPRYGGSHR